MLLVVLGCAFGNLIARSALRGCFNQRRVLVRNLTPNLLENLEVCGSPYFLIFLVRALQRQLDGVSAHIMDFSGHDRRQCLLGLLDTCPENFGLSADHYAVRHRFIVEVSGWRCEAHLFTMQRERLLRS